MLFILSVFYIFWIFFNFVFLFFLQFSFFLVFHFLIFCQFSSFYFFFKSVIVSKGVREVLADYSISWILNIFLILKSGVGFFFLCFSFSFFFEILFFQVFSWWFFIFHFSPKVWTDFLVIVVITVLIGLIMWYRCADWFVRLSDPVTKVNHDLHPELNQGPADLQSAALTTGPCTLGFCFQNNSHDHHLFIDTHRPHR